MLFHMDIQPAESSLVKAGESCVRVANVKDAAGRSPAGSKLSDNGPDESVGCITRKLPGSFVLDSRYDTGINKRFQSLTDAFGIEW